MNINLLAPINKTAALVTQESVNEASFMARRVTHISSMVPLPFNEFTGFKKNHDITGMVFGRLTVLGVFPSIGKAKNRKTCWTTRCKCGRYEVYKGNTLRNNNTSCCSECRNTETLRSLEEKEKWASMRRIEVEPCKKCGSKKGINIQYNAENNVGKVVCQCGNKVNFVSENRLHGLSVWNKENKI